jgi:hypothetical protein
MAGATGTPTRLVLSDRRDTTQVFAELPIQQTQGRLSASSINVASKADRDRVFDLLAGGNGVLILRLSDRTTQVLIALLVTDREDWHRPNCS